jgi:Xaa-Pro aminopeptidase
MKKEAFLIIDTSEENADLYYKTRFFVPDPVIYLEHDGEKILVLSDLEIDRGKKAATVDSVVSLSDLQRRLLADKKRPRLVDAAALLLKDRKIKRVTVPGRFGLKYADELRKEGFRVVPALAEPLFTERLRKTPEEVRLIKDALVKTAQAMDAAIKMIAASEIKKNRLLSFEGGLLRRPYDSGVRDTFLDASRFGPGPAFCR